MAHWLTGVWKRLIIYKESQSINKLSLTNLRAGRMTFHYPVRHIAIKSMQPQRAGHPPTHGIMPDPLVASQSSNLFIVTTTRPHVHTHLCTPSIHDTVQLRPACGAAACGDSAMSLGAWQLILLQTALSGNQRLPHAQVKLTSVSLTFPTINTHRVLVSRIKIHKSKAESMK